MEAPKVSIRDAWAAPPSRATASRKTQSEANRFTSSKGGGWLLTTGFCEVGGEVLSAMIRISATHYKLGRGHADGPLSHYRSNPSPGTTRPSAHFRFVCN